MDREQLLDEVITAYLKAVEEGQRPDPDEWLARHPGLADELAESFAAQRSLDRVAAPLRDFADPPPVNPALAPGETIPSKPTLGTVRHFGDYELLGELGRGGMGVVYQARQGGLSRDVALKMILPGQLASAEAVQRFRAEAKAAATLDHPNVVPIYEVGEHQGQHYFTMKLIEGGSLAQRRADFVLPPVPKDADEDELTKRQKAAAALLAKVARAVQYAHEHHTLHRDLKPGNIVRDANNEPYVTDFGLAKWTTQPDARGEPQRATPEPAPHPGDAPRCSTQLPSGLGKLREIGNHRSTRLA
jgi:serine/threonine protein kinase